MPRVSVDGWEFDYAEHGSGPPIVLLHGLLMDRSMFDHQVERLQDAYRVIAVDAPGHGGSPARAPGFSAWDEAAALAKFADAIGAGRAVWGGQSMGGYKSLRVALNEPQRVRGLILIDSQAAAEDPNLLPQYEAFLTVALSDGVSDDLANLVGLVLFGPGFLDTAAGDPWRRKLRGMDPRAVEGTCRLVFDRDAITERVGGIGAPTLVIHGSEDVAIPVEVGKQTATLMGAQFIEVPGSGHASPVEKPEIVSNAIRAFVDSLPQ